jgi:hypothetical protein
MACMDGSVSLTYTTRNTEHTKQWNNFSSVPTSRDTLSLIKIQAHKNADSNVK